MADRILKTLLGFPGGSELFLCDTIEHEGALWLVPEWLEAPDLKVRKPVRIIRLSGLEYQQFQNPHPADFLLNDPIPKDVFEGRAPSVEGGPFLVVEAPEIVLNDDDMPLKPS